MPKSVFFYTQASGHCVSTFSYLLWTVIDFNSVYIVIVDIDCGVSCFWKERLFWYI